MVPFSYSLKGQSCKGITWQAPFFLFFFPHMRHPGRERGREPFYPECAGESQNCHQLSLLRQYFNRLPLVQARTWKESPACERYSCKCGQKAKPKLNIVLDKKAKHFFVHITVTQPEDSAIYFWAASGHCSPNTCNLPLKLPLMLETHFSSLCHRKYHKAFVIFFCK